MTQRYTLEKPLPHYNLTQANIYFWYNQSIFGGTWETHPHIEKMMYIGGKIMSRASRVYKKYKVSLQAINWKN